MRRLAAGLALIVALCSCASDNEVTGVVLEVTGDLTRVESFVMRTTDGETLTIVPAADGDFRFPLPHLNDHRASLSPIVVELDSSTEPPSAVHIRDADDDGFHE